MSATLTFEPVTPGQFSDLVELAAKNGVKITGNDCTVQSNRCTVAVNYDDGLCVLTLTVESAPLFCTGLAAHKLHDLVEAALNQTEPPQ